MCSAFSTLMALRGFVKAWVLIRHVLSSHHKRVYKAEQEITPEIAAVYEYLASILGGDCAGDKELTFLTLRVFITAHNPPFIPLQ